MHGGALVRPVFLLQPRPRPPGGRLCVFQLGHSHDHAGAVQQPGRPPLSRVDRLPHPDPLHHLRRSLRALRGGSDADLRQLHRLSRGRKWGWVAPGPAFLTGLPVGAYFLGGSLDPPWGLPGSCLDSWQQQAGHLLIRLRPPPVHCTYAFATCPGPQLSALLQALQWGGHTVRAGHFVPQSPRTQPSGSKATFPLPVQRIPQACRSPSTGCCGPGTSFPSKKSDPEKSRTRWPRRVGPRNFTPSLSQIRT